MTGSSAFAGFDSSAMQFWHELASEMSKDWFVANKQRYESQWVAPTTLLLDDVARFLDLGYRAVRAQAAVPDVGGTYVARS